MLEHLKFAAVLALGLEAGLLSVATAQSQLPATAATSTPAASEGGPQSKANGTRSWIARDPFSGRLYQQELVSVSVPTTQWEVKPVSTTVYEPQTVVKSVPTQQTTYTPSTQYVMQPKLRGWWNPLRQPVQAYEYVPVTSWQPQTQTVNQPMTAVEWVPKQQVVYVPQAVQKMQTQQQIVSRELPQSPSGVYPPANQTMLAAQPQPLVTIPILAQQRVLPWPAVGSGYSAPATTTTLTTAPSSLRSMVSNGLRPITNAVTPGYSAPMRTASSAATNSTRDTFQTGMSATVLR